MMIFPFGDGSFILRWIVETIASNIFNEGQPNNILYDEGVFIMIYLTMMVLVASSFE